MKRVLQKALAAYRVFFSPLFGAMGCNCRFYPSCSAYAADALNKYPWPRAAGLIARRLIRCGPWNPGGFDPVR
ncbi:MAG TPA: membrane protein insertion efficiency factor YidD [bacterium]|nr:membrane protein insertion efficiency factor YidD [bacterium]